MAARLCWSQRLTSTSLILETIDGSWLSYPIRLVLRCTLPNPKINRRWYPYTFIMCVILIGVITYLLFWMLIIIAIILETREGALRYYVWIQSNGVEFTLLLLLLMIVLTFFVFWIRQWFLSKRTGLILFIMYLFAITFAILVELDVLFKPNYCPA